ncbi:MAG: autotransporter-associated beta strand repeat-containing protein [Opitutaceae bacterium]|nr:autotransporter-associated beta strand repeat-containing protein [Opitutaceae bacterium]
MLRHAVVLTFVFFTLLAVSLRAQTTYNWIGLGADDNYATPGNWQGGSVPTGNSSDNIIFNVYPRQNITVSSALNLGSLTFNGIRDGLYLSGGSPLTLNGNITTNSNSIYWGVFGLPVVLSAGNHTFNTQGADLYFFNEVSGAGGIIKTGNSSLHLDFANSYTGGTVINGGQVYVSQTNALGTGTVTFNGGTLAVKGEFNYVFLPNNFLLGSSVTFGSPVEETALMEILGTVAPTSGVTDVSISNPYRTQLVFSGSLTDGAAATSYTFAAGLVRLSGNNTYTGGTTVNSGVSVIFDAGAALPSSGLVSALPDGYVGLSDDTFSAATFVSRLDPDGFAGTLGFDGEGTFGGAIDLSGFSYSDILIGTQSRATLTGALTPPSGASAYRFGGNGWLLLADGAGANGLTGSQDVSVESPFSGAPMMLVLGRTAANTYSGSTNVGLNSGVIFDGAASLSANTSVNVDHQAYVGITDGSGLTLGQLQSQLGFVASEGMLGFDSRANLAGNSLAEVTVNNLDLSAFTPFYVGTATKAVLSGTIQTANGDTADYFFGAFAGGALDITASLSGSRALHVGQPGVYQDPDDYGNVSRVRLLASSNTHTGGTFLHSGILMLDTPALLGSGPLTVDTGASDRYAVVETNGNLTNNIILAGGTLVVAPNDPLQLSGNISGPGGLYADNTITLSGNNSYSGGNVFSGRANILAASNSALGTGGLELEEGTYVTFTSSNPAIGSLIAGTPYDDDGFLSSMLELAGSGTTTLTINQTVDGYFEGGISQTGTTTGSLVKNGTGTLTILGIYNSDLPYSGGTTVNQGKLIAGSNAAFGTGAIVLNGGSLGTLPGVTLTNPISFGANGGVLSGSGTISVAITAGTNVRIAPGFSPGVLNFASGLTFASGGQLDFEVQTAAGPAGTGYDLVTVSGALLDITATSGSPFTLKLISLNSGGTAGPVADFSAGSGYSWLVATSVAGINGFAANKFTIDTSAFANSLGGGTFSLVQGVSGGNAALYLNFTPVPEPSTYALMAVGLGAAALAARRRRRS